MNTKKLCRIMARFGSEETDTHCRDCDRSYARGGATLEREFGFTVVILESVSCWPRE